MGQPQGGSSRQVRTVFISDVHLGSRHSQYLALLDFLQGLKPQSLYLVGDVIDGWQLKRCFRWEAGYSRVLQTLAKLSDNGTKIFYIPGNHDEFVKQETFVREMIQRLGFWTVGEEFIFEGAGNRRFLVTHGARFDFVEQSAQWLSKGVGGVYDLALSANWWLSRLLGRKDRSPYWLCAATKDRVKAFIRFISRFEDSLMGHARKKGCQGVICGHLHVPSIVHRDGTTYCNTGDWVENCTALLEYDDGSMELEYYYPYNAATKNESQPALSAQPSPSRLMRPIYSLWNAAACAIATWRST